MKPAEIKRLTDCIGNFPSLSLEFLNCLNTTIPLVSKNRNVILHEQGQRFDKIFVIESGLTVAFQTSGRYENRIYYLWKSCETVIFPHSFFRPHVPTDYFIQTLQPTKLWMIDDTQWRSLKRNFKRDVRLLRDAMYINFIRQQEKLQRLRHMDDKVKYQWYEAIYGTNVLRNVDVAAFLGIKPRTFDRIKNGR